MKTPRSIALCAACVAVGALVACGGTVPPVRYYQLAAPAPAAPAPTTAHDTPATAASAIAVEPLTTDAAYDDERIVYRVDPVRLDYYDYHHWSTTPGPMISSYLQQALAASGQFGAVARDPNTTTAVVVGGHVAAIEEIDDSKQRWIGHLAVELTLTDAKSGDVLWSHTYDEREPLTAQTPEGLARALSVAMARIAHSAAPAIADRARCVKSGQRGTAAAAASIASTCASISARE